LFLEILLFSALGFVAGVFAGLMPGIHPNNILILVLGALPLLSGYPVQAVVAFIVSMVVVNTIVSFIPSVLLGAPEDDTALSVLPGHKLLLEGKGLEAIYLTVIGGVGVVVLSVLLMPVLLLALPIFYTSVKYYTHWLLLAVVLTMILTERGSKKKFWGAVVFLLAGILGLLSFNSTVLQPEWMFFPLFTGLFGTSTLLISLKDKVEIPKQAANFGIVKNALALSGIVKGFFSGLIVGTLPGVGSAQAGTLVQVITRKEDTKEFLVSLGGINTANTLFALVSLYTIGRPRSGAAVAVERIVGNFGFNDLLLLITVTMIVTGVSAVLTLFISKRFLLLIEKIPYDKISLSIILFLILLTAIFTGVYGLLVLAVSTSIGLIAPLTGVRRSLCMGCIILPVISFYSGLSM
jgi:putative membrane protein